MQYSDLSQSDLGMGKKSLGIYSLGVALCVVLTLIPFAAVDLKLFSHATTLLVIFIAAIAQFFVQVVCFLRLSFKTEQGRVNIFSFLFAGFVLFVIIGGSMWIMWHLNYNMMH